MADSPPGPLGPSGPSGDASGALQLSPLAVGLAALAFSVPAAVSSTFKLGLNQQLVVASVR